MQRAETAAPPSCHPRFRAPPNSRVSSFNERKTFRVLVGPTASFRQLIGVLTSHLYLHSPQRGPRACPHAKSRLKGFALCRKPFIMYMPFQNGVRILYTLKFGTVQSDLLIPASGDKGRQVGCAPYKDANPSNRKNLITARHVGSNTCKFMPRRKGSTITRCVETNSLSQL